jgi:HPt (histidine-containing phosphotransfer) domain-containing protein
MEQINEKTEKIIDLGYLVELSKGDKVFVKEMVTLFLSENPLEIESLEKGILERNFELIKTVAHKLRSTIPFVGLDVLIETEVSEIEILASARMDIEEIEKRFLKIKPLCERACLELES